MPTGRSPSIKSLHPSGRTTESSAAASRETSRTRPIRALRATGPPVNSSAGAVAQACHCGSNSATGDATRPVEDDTQGSMVTVVENQHHPAEEVGISQPGDGDQQVAGQLIREGGPRHRDQKR